MSKVVFITNNSPEIRKKLEEAGFSICICAKFEDSVWLDYYPESNHTFDIHGTGYTDKGDWDEKYSPLERIKIRLEIKDYYSEEREFFDTVDEFLEKYERNKISSNC